MFQTLGLVALVVTLASDDAATVLVGRLGASRYGDRQEAAAGLLDIGRSALPALRIGRDGRDPEVRLQATALIELIESRLLVEPTLIDLRVQDAPLAEVVRAISERAGMTVDLAGGAGAGRTVTLNPDGPVPFWDAVARVAAIGGVQPMVAVDPSHPDRGGMPRVLLTAGSLLAEPAVSGPFLAIPMSIDHHREVSFGPRVASPILNRGQDRVKGPANGPGETFAIRLQILAEPRLSLGLEGQPTVVEAIDDQNQNLAFDNGPTLGFSVNSTPALPSIPVTLALRYPEQPSRIIRKLRASLPISVVSRRAGPMALELADAVGKSAHCSESTFTIVDAKADQNGGMQVDVRIQSNEPTDEVMPNLPRTFSGIRPPDSYKTQLEIVDGEGQTIPWTATNFNLGPDGIRMTLRTNPNGGQPPEKLLIYDLSRSRTKVEFTFENVAMPVP